MTETRPLTLSLSDLTRIAVFAALVAALGLAGAVSLFGNAVPITLQTLGVMLAGTILGAWRGAISMTVLLVLVAVGFPLLSGGRGGFGVFLGPSAGYLLGWVAGAAVIGLIAAPRAGVRPRAWRVLVACLVGGIAVVYLIGVPVQSLVTGVPLGETALLSLAFVPGDIVKAVLATLITIAVAKAYPAAFGGRRSTTTRSGSSTSSSRAA